jgi:hypothetical protein
MARGRKLRHGPGGRSGHVREGIGGTRPVHLTMRSA